MENCFKNRRFLNIFLLIFLAGFLVLPQICLSDELKQMNQEEIGKYLELPVDDVKNLLSTLIQVLTNEGINLLASGYSTDEAIAVVSILREVVRIDVLNHLLIDAPIEITGKIIKNTLKIARIFLTQDISVVFDEFEKESVRKAIEYGMNVLFQNEIRVTPGAIEFRYRSYKGEEKEVVFQYLIIYKPLDDRTGKVEIRFYSTNYIEPPESKGSIGFTRGIYHDLQRNLPPFITEISGKVEKTQLENYHWKENPVVEISFPETVPDLGIRPLTFWEKQILKPIESSIKEIEIIVTKVTGKSIKIVENIRQITETAFDIWNGIKSTISKVNPFAPATIVETPAPEQSLAEEGEEEQLMESEPKIEIKPAPKEVKPKPLTLEEIQEMLDDIAEKIDVISVEVVKLTGEEKKITETKEKEKLEEEEIEESGQGVEQKLCQKIPGSYPMSNKVIINEIAWMGTANSANDEWIELKNISGTSLDLTGWQLLDKDGQIKIILDSREQFSANGFYILERTSDDTILEIKADKIYSGNLNNNNEALYLFDKDCQLKDEVLAFPSWPGGDNSSKRTMERKIDFNWQTSSNIGGTPKRENSNGYYQYYASGGTSPPPQSTEPTLCSENNLSPFYSPIIFNEIAWMGSDTNYRDEWIELKNLSTSTILLSGWQLISTNTTNNENKIKIFFDESNLISTSSYFLLERTDDNSVPGIPADKIFTGSINDSDFLLELFDKDCILIDKIQATSSWPAGQKEGEKRTMERAEDLNWYTSNATTSLNGLFGTPKARNSILSSSSSLSNLLFNETTSEITLTNRNSPYLVTANLTVPQNKTLFIEAGVIMKFCQDCELTVEGKIQTLNTTTTLIVFTSWRDDEYGGDTNQDGFSQGQEGDWRRIYFKNSTNSNLNNIIVRYGGELYPTSPPFTDASYLPALHIEGGQLQIENATITDCFARGMWLDNSSSTINNIYITNIRNSSTTRPAAAIFVTGTSVIIQNSIFFNNSIGVEIGGGNHIITNSTFKNNSVGIEIKNGNPRIENNSFENNETPIYLYLSTSPTFSGNLANTQTNNINGILIADTELVATTTWQADLPYVIDKNLTISQNGALILQPGVTMKFKKQSDEQKPSIIIYGQLIAQITSTQPIVFTSFSDDYINDTNGNGTSTQPTTSDWYSLHFYSSSSTLDGVIIRYGGSTFMVDIGAIAFEENIQVSIRNSIFENNRCVFTLIPPNSTTTQQIINQWQGQNVIFCNNYNFPNSSECDI